MEEHTIHCRNVFHGKLIQLDVVDVELEDGTRSVREIVRHPGAVCILVRDRGGDFLLVRQFRKPVESPMLEVVAGTREEDESAEACARRELREETGHEAALLERLGTIHPSPGYVTERIEAFYAEVDGDPGETEPDHDEHLDLVVVSPGELDRAVRDGEITDGKTLGSILLYEKHRGGGWAAAPGESRT